MSAAKAATLFARPQGELEVTPLPQPPEIGAPGRWLPVSAPDAPPVRPDAPERHPSLITAEAELDAQRIRGEAELVLRRAELDAELIRQKAEVKTELLHWDARAELVTRKAELDAELVTRKADLYAQHREAPAELDAYERGLRARPLRGRLMSAPILAIAVLAALTSGLWHGSLQPLVSVILASAAAAFGVAYSVAILISSLRLVFGSYRSGPHPGAATALHLLVGVGSTRRGRVPLE